MPRRNALRIAIVIASLGVVVLIYISFKPAHTKQSSPITFTNSNSWRVTVDITDRSVFFVSGEVRNPGAYELQEASSALTLGEAIQMAGGVTDFADISHILVQHSDGSSNVISLLEEGSKPVITREIIRVPKKHF